MGGASESGANYSPARRDFERSGQVLLGVSTYTDDSLLDHVCGR